LNISGNQHCKIGPIFQSKFSKKCVVHLLLSCDIKLMWRKAIIKYTSAVGTHQIMKIRAKEYCAKKTIT